MPLPYPETTETVLEAQEIFFDDGNTGVRFRTVSWPRATVIFLKIQFAMSILAGPGALSTVGAVGSALSIVGWTVLNTYTAVILGDSRNRLLECHSESALSCPGSCYASHPGGSSTDHSCWYRVLLTAFNAFSEHGACTVVFSFMSATLITLFSSVRTFPYLGLLTWLGFTTFFIALFMFVVAETQQGRSAAAPKTGDFDLGWVAIAHPGFVVDITASLNLFVFSSGSQMYLRVVSKMRKPRDYRKAAIVAGILAGAIYLSFSLVIYHWCGVYLVTPAFGSVGTFFKKTSYGIALPGLVTGVGIYQSVAAKLLFVRLVRSPASEEPLSLLCFRLSSRRQR